MAMKGVLHLQGLRGLTGRLSRTHSNSDVDDRPRYCHEIVTSHSISQMLPHMALLCRGHTFA